VRSVVASAHPNPILSLPMDSFTAALGRLDAASRALLDLSLRRGMKPEEIGDLLGTDSESVVVAREAALEQLATELDMDDVAELDEVRTRLAELPAEAWTGTAETDRPNLKVVAAEPAEPPTKSRRSRLPLLLALLAVAAVALVIVLASSGSSEKPKTRSQSSAPAPSPPQKPAKQPAPVAKKAQLAALGDASGATGTAALTQGGKRLTIDATGLPDGTYQVWLYNSVIDAVSLVTVRGTKLTLDLKLPSHASHYRYVDVSREPADGNPNHSGQSVLRVPLAKLSR
jgi:anti-sigma-K factor RskA